MYRYTWFVYREKKKLKKQEEKRKKMKNALKNVIKQIRVQGGVKNVVGKKMVKSSNVYT